MTTRANFIERGKQTLVVLGGGCGLVYVVHERVQADLGRSVRCRTDEESLDNVRRLTSRVPASQIVTEALCLTIKAFGLTQGAIELQSSLALLLRQMGRAADGQCRHDQHRGGQRQRAPAA